MSYSSTYKMEDLNLRDKSQKMVSKDETQKEEDFSDYFENTAKIDILHFNHHKIMKKSSKLNGKKDVLKEQNSPNPVNLETKSEYCVNLDENDIGNGLPHFSVKNSIKPQTMSQIDIAFNVSEENHYSDYKSNTYFHSFVTKTKSQLNQRSRSNTKNLAKHETHNVPKQFIINNIVSSNTMVKSKSFFVNQPNNEFDNEIYKKGNKLINFWKKVYCTLKHSILKIYKKKNSLKTSFVLELKRVLFNIEKIKGKSEFM